MSDHNEGGDPEHTHEYTVLVRPSVRASVGADTGERGLEAFSVTIDFDRSGVSAPPGTAELMSGRQAVEWRGFELEVYRNGVPVLGDGRGLDTSEVLGYIDDVAMRLKRLSQRLR